MRYMIISYMKRPNGQRDEIVEIDKKYRDRHMSTASVVLDFAQQAVLKSSLEGVTIPRDWQRIRDYYHQHYADVIDKLEALHGCAPPPSIDAENATNNGVTLDVSGSKVGDA